ncbi:MAG: pyridoxamine 5'-phosphate oxidase family protein [Smithellaceae bacterium]
MNFEDCVKFAVKNPVAWLATADGDQPRVRGLGLWFADQSGFYFQTVGMKDICKQLQANPKVELAFYQAGGMAGTMLRVTGSIEFLTDPELKKKVLEDRPFLKSFRLTADSPLLTIFRISKGEAYFWTMETDIKPKEMIKFG